MKKILAILLALTLVFTLVACTNEKDTESDVKTSATQIEVENIEISSAQSNESVSSEDASSDTETQSSKPVTSSSLDEMGESSKLTESSKPVENKPVVSKPATTPTPSKPTESSKPAESSKPTESSKTTHSHEYYDATCTEPQKCYCGKTKGSALGHKWKKVNCEYDQCQQCWETKENGGKHDWKAASCTEGRHCTKCGFIDGNEDELYPLGHNFGYDSDGDFVCLRCKEKCYDSNVLYNEAKSLAKGIIRQIIRDDMQEWQKVKAIHDYLYKNVDYDDGYYNSTMLSESGQAFGALKNKKAICSGYARAFELLCNEVGIESVIITSPNHAWNQVKINDKWYNIDVTWDDGEYNHIARNYLYFLVNDSNFYESHQSQNAKYICSDEIEGIKICINCFEFLSVEQEVCSCGCINFKPFNHSVIWNFIINNSN